MGYLTSIEDGERAAARYVLAPPRSVVLGAGGSRLGWRAGSSLEFQEHREYEPGDDLRHLDWSAYARSDRLITKLYREEVSPHLDLLLDGSRSMDLAGSAKARAAVGLLAFLARAGLHGGFSLGAWIAVDGCRPLGAPGAEPSAWGEIELAHDGGLVESFGRLAPRWRPCGIRVLVSDLLSPDEPRTVLGRLGRGAAAVWVLQVLAAADGDPEVRGFSRLEDVESGETRDLLLDAGAVSRYRRAFGAHRERWLRACREAGAVMVSLVAERVVDGWAPEALEELVQSGLVEVA